jgi:hypothetical protein
MASKRIVAVMQPYFMAYAGYYRLLAAADDFVIFDCVQFPRRGWVHRNRLPNAAGEAAWLTLPLAPAPFDVLIKDIVFADDAQARLAEQLRRFPSLEGLGEPAARVLDAGGMSGPLVDYLERQLVAVRDLFGLSCRFQCSSGLDIDPALRAQDRILAILGRLEASHYVNAPGGRALYDETAFADAGVRLHFLPDYQGSTWSLLHELAVRTAEDIAGDILAQTPSL